MSSHDTAPAGSPLYYIPPLLLEGAPHWGPNGSVLSDTQVGQAVTVAYAFARTAPETGIEPIQFAPFSSAQQDAARQALASWSAVANLNFVETPVAASAQIRFATNWQEGRSAAYTYSPGPAPGGGVFLAGDAFTNINPVPSSYGYLTLVHEIGHALGLKHPGNYDALTNGGIGPFLPESEDNLAYSVMSYRRGSTPPGTWPTGPSILDIATVQYLYGPNMTAAPGDDVYTLNTLTYRAVWDPNGINALDARGQTVPATIDLRPGTISTAGGLASVGLAHGSRMQRAYGGAGDDTLVPNGGSLLDGGGGVNTALYSGTRAQYAVGDLGGGAFVVTGPDGASSVLISMQAATFADGETLVLAPGTAPTFDALRYLASNPDVAIAVGPDAAAATSHLMTLGVFEGRPLTRFDPALYLAANPDVQATIGNDDAAATRHYVEYGIREGRSSGVSTAMASLDTLEADTEAFQREMDGPVPMAPAFESAFQNGNAASNGNTAATSMMVMEALPFQPAHRSAGDLLIGMASLS